VALGTVACGQGRALSPAAFSQAAKSVQSLAAEGALVAQDASAGRSTAAYVRVHGAALSEAASKSAAALRAEKSAPALAQRARTLRALATRIAADLKRLEHASSAEQRRLAHELASAAARSTKLAKEQT